MNPRQFCREPGFPLAILLTFDFDPIFFERVGLQDLWAGEASEILVVADSLRLAQFMDRWKGNVHHLGRRYQLAPSSAGGAFHPKVILRLSDAGGAIWVGSGNLTSGGWGGNRELASAWRFGPGLADDGSWLLEFLAWISSSQVGAMREDTLTKARECSWVQALSGSPTLAPLLFSRDGTTLAAQLRRRFKDREFSEAWVISGSTDSQGAFIAWLHSNLKVKKCRLVVDPERSSLDLAKIRKLPVPLSIEKPLEPGALHAKLLWLRGRGGDSLVMGSANCSAAAWLLDPARGGNREVVVVLDDVEREAFQLGVDYFAKGNLENYKPLSNREQLEVESATEGELRVREVYWEQSSGELHVRLAAKVPRLREIRLAMDGAEFRCVAADPEGLHWVSPGSDPFGDDPSARIIRVQAVLTKGRALIAQSWIHDLAELRHSSMGSGIVGALQRLSIRSEPSEHQRIVSALQRVSAALLGHPGSFPDPSASMLTQKTGAPERSVDAEAIEPEQMVRLLSEVPSHRESKAGPMRVGGLSLVGVMRALFGWEASDAVGGESASAEPESPDDDDTQGVGGTSPKSEKKSERKSEEVDERSRQRLEKQLEEFIGELASDEFAQSCTASQLVQAACYPLAVGILGRRGGFVTGELACLWASEVFDVLFRLRIAEDANGLIEFVRNRYTEKGRGADFDLIVGDGQLWLVLLLAASSHALASPRERFDRALLLQSILNGKGLLQTAEPGRLTRLLGGLDGAQQRKLLSEARNAAGRVSALERYLHKKWNMLLADQTSRAFDHKAEDLLWRDQIGWAVVQEDCPAGEGQKVLVYLHARADYREVRAAGFYVNVNRAAATDPEIARLARLVVEAVQPVALSASSKTAPSAS